MATLTSQLTANVSRLPNVHDSTLQASVFEACYLSRRRRERKPSISALIPPSKATLCLFRIVCVGFFFDVMFFFRQRLVCQRCGIVSLVLSRLSRKREPLMNLAQQEYSNRGRWAGKQEREMRICESRL